MLRCPGQDERFWKPEDIFEVKCSGCGEAIEFFKDEPKLKCCKCGQMVINPKIQLGCVEWCKYAEQCIGHFPPEKTIDRIWEKIRGSQKCKSGKEK